MGKVKFGVGDAKAAAKVDGGQFQDYSGPIPPKGVYEGIIKLAKLKVSKNGHPMMMVVVELDSKDKKKAKYNGCPVISNVVIMDKTLGMVNQFLDALAGSTAKGRKARNTFWEEGVVVAKGEKKDSNLGTVEEGNITSIGGIKLTGKNRIILSGEPGEWEGKERFDQNQWIVPSDDDADDDDLDDDEDDLDDEYDDEDDDDDEEDDDDASDDDEDDEEDDTDDDGEEYEDEPEEEPVKSKKKGKKKPF